MKTLKVTRREAKLLNLGQFPNAGPNPDIIGMKIKWGGNVGWKDVLCVSDGTYLYKVDQETYTQIKEITQQND
jgi:hypothetical protein